MSIELTEEYLGKARRVKNSVKTSFHTSTGQSVKSYYYTSIPQEAVFKVINDNSKVSTNGKNPKGSIKGYTVKKAIQYIGTDKEYQEEQNENINDGLELEKNIEYNLENHLGEKINSIDDINTIYNNWQKTFSSLNRKNGKDAEHILFSTSEKPGESNEQILAAARETLKTEFGNKGYEYVFALHTDKDHTHVHAIVRSFNPETKKQLDIRKDDIKNIRKSFASNLRENGLNYVASLNIDRIKSMSDRLEYIKTKNLTWFESNIEKMKEVNIDELGERLLTTQKEINVLKTRKNEINDRLQNIYYNKSKNLEKDDLRTELYHINKDVTKKYADIRAIITLLNNLEYESQVANINYEKLKENQSKVTGVFLKNSKSYKELSDRVENARSLMISKKLELDKAHIYLSKLNADKHYKIDLESNKNITYAFNNFESSLKTFRSVEKEEHKLDKNIIEYSLTHIEKLNQSINDSTTFINKKSIHELNTLKEQYQEQNKLPEYNKAIRDILHNDLKKVIEAHKKSYHIDQTISKDDYLKTLIEIRSLQQNIRKNYEIPIYKLKKHIDISKFSQKKAELQVNAIKLNAADKDIVMSRLIKLQQNPDFSQKLYLKKIIDNVNDYNTIYQSQLNRLQIDHKKLFKELSVKSFQKIDIKQDVVNTEKTYVNWYNNDYIHIAKNRNMDYKVELEKLKHIDINSLHGSDKNEYMAKLSIISDNAVNNKDLNSFDEVNKIALIDKEMTIKEYGDILQVSAKRINLEIWEDIFQEDKNHYKQEFLTSENNQEFYQYDYKKEFLERYLEHLKNEYSFQKEPPGENEPQENWNKYFNDLENFDNMCESFKTEYLEDKEKASLTQEILTHLENGEFNSANELIKSPLLDEFDKLYVNSQYDYYINDYANNLDSIKERIDFDSSVEQQAYFSDNDDSIYKKDKTQEKPTLEKVDLPHDKKEEKVHTDKIDLHQDKVQVQEPKKIKLDYNYLVQKEQELIKQFVNNSEKILTDHKQRENSKINSINLSNKNKVIAAAKSVTYALNSNMKELIDTQKYLEVIKKDNLSQEVKTKLINNLEEYKKITVNLNQNVNKFITNVNNSKLSKEEKHEVLNAIYNKLDEINYYKEVKPFFNSKDQLTENFEKENTIREVNQYKDLTSEIKQTKDPKKLEELSVKSEKLTKQFKERDLPFTTQLKVRSLENKQKSIFKNMNRGFGR